MNNKWIFSALLALTLTSGLQAQTGTKSSPAAGKPKAATAVPTKEELISVDLSPIGLKATMKAPASAKPVTGKYSNSIVGDNNFEISVEETGSTLAELKAEIEANADNKIVESTATTFVFTTSMMGRSMAHFECVLSIGGVTYRFYDKRVAPLNAAQLKPMVDAVKSITAL